MNNAAHPSRRTLLQAATLTAALPAWPLAALAQERRFEPRVQGWRTFEVTTTVAVADHQGTSKVWIPVPAVDTEYQRTLDHAWSGNATQAALVADPDRGVRMLYAEFAPTVKAPVLTHVSRVQTRDRAEDWKPEAIKEDPAVLRAALVPTDLLPLDGIVRATALKAIGNATGDLEKTRAIYRWVVTNAHREPKVRGCGTGDIKSMLETGNLGGKCADLNAVFVGLCRAVGVPARDVYGVRLAPSAFGYRELGANSANLKGAQHCRAEVFLKKHGWVAMDPADVTKVMRQETPEWIKDAGHPVVTPVRKALFGSWEGNWMGYNTASDIALPGAKRGKLGFFMYPQAETGGAARDPYDPDSFAYQITAREIKA